MTIDRIHTGPLGAIDPSGREGRSPTAIGETSVRAVALAVVGRIAAELSLAGRPQPLTTDPYRLRSLADAAASSFPDRSPAAEGDLARAIEALAGVIAADMAGRTDGSTLERVDGALAGFTPAREGVEGVTEFLEEVTRRLDDAR